MSYAGGFNSDSTGGSGNGQPVNGAVFITNVTPTGSGNVGGKVFSSNGRVLDQCIADTDFVTVHILAQTGHSNYVPGVLVNGLAVTLSEDEDQTVWTGSIAIDRAGTTTIAAVHEDGSSHVISILSDTGPSVTDAEFTGGYPAMQSELKAGDTFDLVVSTAQDMVELELDNFGASGGQSFTFSATTAKTVTFNVADRGNTTQALGVRVRAKNANGSYGPWFETTSAGSTDGQYTIALNNLHPSASINQITYPSGQGALKNTETATVQLTASNYDTVQHTSPNSQLTIANPSTFEANKTVTRAGGNYNVTADNFRITLTRNANAATTLVEDVVRIAHAAPVIQITTPATRLRSGGNQGTSVQSHTITVQSDQLLASAPSITAGGGTLTGSMSGAAPGLSFTQVLQVHDNDTKGTFQFVLTQAVNLAGRSTTQIASGEDYVLGGFVSRTMAIPRFEREVAIGTNVSDTDKLVTADKDSTAMTYHDQFGNQLLGYTITGPTGQLNDEGDLWYWLDDQAVGNNTTGGATVTIEETI